MRTREQKIDFICRFEVASYKEARSWSTERLQTAVKFIKGEISKYKSRTKP